VHGAAGEVPGPEQARKRMQNFKAMVQPNEESDNSAITVHEQAGEVPGPEQARKRMQNFKAMVQPNEESDNSAITAHEQAGEVPGPEQVRKRMQNFKAIVRPNEESDNSAISVFWMQRPCQSQWQWAARPYEECTHGWARSAIKRMKLAAIPWSSITVSL
jgi:hypothetical protein